MPDLPAQGYMPLLPLLCKNLRKIRFVFPPHAALNGIFGAIEQAGHLSKGGLDQAEPFEFFPLDVYGGAANPLAACR